MEKIAPKNTPFSNIYYFIIIYTLLEWRIMEDILFPNGVLKKWGPMVAKAMSRLENGNRLHSSKGSHDVLHHWPFKEEKDG